MGSSTRFTVWISAKTRFTGLKADFRVGNVVDLAAYQNNSFDLVIDSNCLHMVIGDTRGDCLASVYRVLTPGGLSCVSSQCRNPEVTDKYVVTETIHFDPKSALLVKDGLPYYHLKLPSDVLDELTTAGFEILDWRMRPKDKDEEPYLLGALLANAVKPGRAAGEVTS